MCAYVCKIYHLHIRASTPLLVGQFPSLNRTDASAIPRYFQCEDKYGLFAPSHRVSPARNLSSPSVSAGRASPALYNMARSQSSGFSSKLKQQPSQESLNSRGSSTSSPQIFQVST